MTGVFQVYRCCKKQRYSQTAKKITCPICNETMKPLPDWYIAYKHNGKTIVERIGQKQLAKAVLAKRLTEIKEQRYFPSQLIMTWNEAVNRFMEWAESNVSEKTVAMYRNSTRALLASFSGKDFHGTTLSDMEAFKSRRLGEVSGSSLNRDLATFKRMAGVLDVHFAWLRKLRLVPENSPRERILTKDEATRLLNEANDRLRTAIMIALWTGLRKESIYTLHANDIDLEHRIIRKETKGGKQHRIPIGPTLYEFLRPLVERGGWIIPSPDNPSHHVSLNSNLGFPEACKRAGIENLRFHDLRHTMATEFFLVTKDIVATGKMLDHKKVATTQRYVNVPDEHLRELVQRFDAMT